jgi:hypothetical protein
MVWRHEKTSRATFIANTDRIFHLCKVLPWEICEMIAELQQLWMRSARRKLSRLYRHRKFQNFEKLWPSPEYHYLLPIPGVKWYVRIRYCHLLVLVERRPRLCSGIWRNNRQEIFLYYTRHGNFETRAHIYWDRIN